MSEKDYLEVRAGVEHLTSFSPQEQVVRVSKAIVHVGYDAECKFFLKEIEI